MRCRTRTHEDLALRVGAHCGQLVFQRPLQHLYDLAGGVDPVATPTGDLLEDAPLFEGTDQPASGLEGDAHDLVQLADGGHGVRE
jgi:hypothetical protein